MNTAIQAYDLHGIVLKKDLAAENYKKLYILTSEQGLLCCLERISRTTKKTQSDLFDQACIEINPPKGKGYPFVKNYTPLHRSTAISKSYYAFNDAAFLLTYSVST